MWCKIESMYIISKKFNCDSIPDYGLGPDIFKPMSKCLPSSSFKLGSPSDISLDNKYSIDKSHSKICMVRPETSRVVLRWHEIRTMKAAAHDTVWKKRRA